MLRPHLVLLVGSALLVSAWAAAVPVVSWPFDQDLAGWNALDPATATLQITRDPAAARPGGDGAATLRYTRTLGGLAGLGVELKEPLTSGKSLRFWLRTQAPTLVLLVLNEADGSSYNTAFFSLPAVWQEIAVNLAEFTLGDDSSDENGKLDLDQVNSVGLADAGGLVAKLVESLSLLQPPELGPQQLWLDDFAVSDEGVEPRWEVLQPEGRREVRLESFEGLPLQWLILSAAGTEVAYDNQVRHEGELSLRVRYKLPAGKLLVLLTNPGQAPLGGATRLRFAVRSQVDTTLIVGFKERDGSQYSAVVPVAASPDLAVKELALADLKLSDDSRDENGRLDIGQVKEFTVGDVSGLLGKGLEHNELWLDDFVFVE